LISLGLSAQFGHLPKMADYDNDEETKQPLLPSSANIVDKLQKLTQIVQAVDRGISGMGGIRDTSSYRKNLHDTINNGVHLGHEIADDLKGYNDKNKNKLAMTYGRELKKLEALGRELAMKERQIMARMSTTNVNALADLEKGEPSDLASPKTMAMKATVQVLDPDVAMLDDRALALRDIQQDVQKLNEMTKDMAYLIEEQQVMVDRIEVNTDTAATKTKDGEQQLVEAAKHQKKSRSWQCWLLLLLLIVLTGLVLGFVVVPRLLSH
jgi:hypothetical protein